MSLVMKSRAVLVSVNQLIAPLRALSVPVVSGPAEDGAAVPAALHPGGGPPLSAGGPGPPGGADPDQQTLLPRGHAGVTPTQSGSSGSRLCVLSLPPRILDGSQARVCLEEKVVCFLRSTCHCVESLL